MTKIKICGFTNPAETAYVNGSPVYAMGMVLFCPKSRRNITLARAREIMAAAEPRLKKVAVVVSPSVEQEKEIEACGFDFLQVHGKLTDEVLAAGTVPIIRAMQVGADGVPELEEHPRIAAYLLDAAAPGSGKTFDWNEAAKLPRTKPLILAGGLTPDNVADAIGAVHPDMVDVSSGVEYGDGRKGKDPVKVAAFIRAVEAAG